MSRFRVLSLDGGGIKGTFTASVLANCEQLTGKRIVDHFDLITGTSTGGLIALGLGLGMTADEILRFYVDRGPEIFPSTGLQGIRHAFRPKYSQEVLSRALVDMLGGRRLGESKCRLVIPSFDCNAGRVQLFKTAHDERFIQDYRMPAHEVAMATAAAPTYFPAFAAQDGQAFLDGGIWANCPIVIGLLEAVFELGNDPSSIDALSIGTTDASFDVPKQQRLGGILTWNKQLVTLLMRAQIDGALAQAQIITGKRATRIDETTRPGRFSLDDASQIEELRGLGARTAKDSLDEVASRFLDTPVEAFVPCHQLKTSSPRSRKREGKVARRRRRHSLGIARPGIANVVHKIIDISVSGALLETEGEIPVGQVLELDLLLENGAKARVQAKVVRVQHPGWGVAAGVGVRFTRFHGSALEAIEGYVDGPLPREAGSSAQRMAPELIELL